MNLSNYCDICGESSGDLIALFAGQPSSQRELPLAAVCPDCLTYDLVRVAAAEGMSGVIGYVRTQRASA